MLCILSGFLFSACSDDNDQSEIETRRPIELSQQTRATAGDLLEFYVNFTIDMAKSGDADIKNENIAVSPISAAMVFAMTANGIEGSNQKEYLEYLGTSDLNALNSLCTSLISQLPEADKKVSLNLANSIWANKCFDHNSQSTSISVDESGAVAASVTSGDIPIIALPVEDKVTVKIDRPFFFFINEYSTAACIVSGRIANI